MAHKLVTAVLEFIVGAALTPMARRLCHLDVLSVVSLVLGNLGFHLAIFFAA
jgi:hypothetical protein